MKPTNMTKMTDEDIQRLVSRAVEDAQAFIQSDIAPDRIRSDKYFKGGVGIGHEEGRSKVVATKCRDKVRQVKPALMRLFLQSGRPVEYLPENEQMADQEEQITLAAQAAFERNGGYRVIGDMIHDSLTKKQGIAKVYEEEVEDVQVIDVSGVPDDEFTFIAAPDEVKVVEHTEENGFHDAKLEFTQKRKELSLISIPPEDFFIDDGATSIDDYYVCGHVQDMRVGDVAAMGFDFNKVLNMAGTEDDAAGEEEEREEYRSDSEDETQSDPAMRKIMLTEAYMRIDAEGTGKPQLYAVLLGGTKMEFLRKDVVQDNPFAVFEIDPEPHTFFGRSLVEIIENDQDAATSMLRGILDNVAMTNTPRMAVNQNNVTMDDVLNNEIGAIIRTKGTPSADLLPLSVPFAAGATLPALQYFDQSIDDKTGVSRASMGLDPDVLQQATATAVNATMSGAHDQIELMGRNLAEGGMTRLFKLLRRLIAPDAGDADVTVNVGLGTGQIDTKVMGLQFALAQQQQIWANYGPMNGVVTMTNMRNTMADLLEASGIKNVGRHFAPMDPQKEQQLLQQAAASQPEQADPNAAFLQSEKMKVDQKAQSDQMDAQIEMQKAAAENDLERDKLLQDGVLKAADLVGKYGVGPDLVRLYQQQANN